MDELIVASRAIHFAAVALLFGAPLYRLWVEPRRADAPAARTVALAAAVAAVLSGVGWFAAVAADMAGGWSNALAPGLLGAVAVDTRFGRVWLARLALLVAIIAVSAFGGWSRRKDIVLLALAALATASLVGVGHGTEGAGALGPIHAVADMIHLLCAATWIGGLFCLALALRRAAVDGIGKESLHVVLPRFSRVGYAAVALLLISGCINALVLLPRPDALLTTAYGRVLLVKVGLALLMVAIALVNRVVLVSRVVPAGGGALWRSVMVEQGVGLLVLVTAAWLGTLHSVP